jgi:hypothetical protein
MEELLVGRVELALSFESEAVVCFCRYVYIRNSEAL